MFDLMGGAFVSKQSFQTSAADYILRMTVSRLILSPPKETCHELLFGCPSTKQFLHGIIDVQLPPRQLLIEGQRPRCSQAHNVTLLSSNIYYIGPIWSFDGGKLRGRKKPRPQRSKYLELVKSPVILSSGIEKRNLTAERKQLAVVTLGPFLSFERVHVAFLACSDPRAMCRPIYSHQTPPALLQ